MAEGGRNKDRLDWGDSITLRDHDTGTLPQIELGQPGVGETRVSASRIPLHQLPSLAVGTRLGDYEIAKKIGEGAMSEVYLAIHPTIGRRVAIKLISARLFADPDAKERFISEARAVAAIHHPGIVHVFGFGTYTDGRAYLIMEWLSGESLGARLRRGPILIDDALDIVLQIANALRAAHEHGIIHRDLKSENIYLQEIRDEKPVVKILDFGIAKRVDDREDSRAGRLVGTPLYMSPEQCQGKSVDQRTDIYAFGCICYELLTGRLPFVATDVTELVAAHITETPPAPNVLRPDLPGELSTLIRSMLAKEPSKRPSLDAVRRLVQSMLHSSQVMAAVGADPDLQQLPLPAPAKSFPPRRLDDLDEQMTLREGRRPSKQEEELAPTLDGTPFGEASTLDSNYLTPEDIKRRRGVGRTLVLGAIVFLLVAAICIIFAINQ